MANDQPTLAFKLEIAEGEARRLFESWLYLGVESHNHTITSQPNPTVYGVPIEQAYLLWKTGFGAGLRLGARIATGVEPRDLLGGGS